MSKSLLKKVELLQKRLKKEHIEAEQSGKALVVKDIIIHRKTIDEVERQARRLRLRVDYSIFADEWKKAVIYFDFDVA